MKGDSLLLVDWMSEWLSVVILAAVIIAIVVADFFRNFRKRRLMKWGSYALIFFALAGLILSPEYRVERQASNIVLLTDQYSQSILDSLLEVQPNIKVYAKLFSDQPPYNAQSESIKSIYELTVEGIQADNFSILGEGLATYELEVITNYDVKYYPPELPPSGIVELAYERTIYEQKSMTISGKINGRTGSIKVVLYEAQTKLDSVQVDSTGDFSISHTPKVSGLYLYSLSEYKQDSLIAIYPLPVEVIPGKKMSVLFINEFPVFDTKYLRDHLVKAGHRVVIRSKYSKQRFSYEYYNTDNKQRIDLTSSSLESYDIVIIDHQSLSKLTRSQLNNLQVAIKEQGLSLLLQNISPNNRISKIKLYEGLSIHKDRKTDFKISDNIAVTGSDIKVSKGIPLTSQYSENPLGGYKYSGLGKVAILTFQNSYELILDGYNELHGALWDDVLKILNRKSEDEHDIDITQLFPVVDMPLGVRMIASCDTIHTALFDGVKVATKQNYHLSNRWTGRYWTNKSGWHSLSVNQTSKEVNRYVFKNTDWMSLRRNQQIAENINFSKSNKAELTPYQEYSYQELSPFIFYFLFLIGSIYLWIEMKL